MTRFWNDIEEFYDADPRRRTSGELDFGCMWVEIDRPRWPQYRVSWVDDTGEVYAVRLNHGRIELLGKVEGREQAEQALRGWAMISPMTLDWVRDRLR